jgi:hypothetical protein
MTGGYIQAEILGKTRALKFGALAAENIFTELYALGVATSGVYSSEMVATIIYWGLYNWHRHKKVDMDVDYEQVADWVDDKFYDETSQELFNQIVRCYEDSKSVKMLEQNLAKSLDGVKKKMEHQKQNLSTSPDPKAGSTSEALPSESSAGASATTATQP